MRAKLSDLWWRVSTWAFHVYWCCYYAWAFRVCERKGHLWGASGVGFDGENTIHWAECKRCGYSDSD